MDMFGGNVTPAGVTLINKLDKYATNYYDLYTAQIRENEAPIYVVLNRDTGVIEFQHEVLMFALEWMKHFTDKLSEFFSGNTTDKTDKANLVNFN